jgi:hypothetical protein
VLADPIGLLKPVPINPTVNCDAVVPVVNVTGVYVGLAFRGVAETVNVLAPVICKMKYVVPATKFVPVVVAGTKGIPAITPTVASVCDTVTMLVVAVVFVTDKTV